MLYVRHFRLNPEFVNSYVIVDEESGQALLVDAGEWSPEIARFLEKSGLTLTGIFITHRHYDHAGALPEYTARYPNVRVYCEGAVDAGSGVFVRVRDGDSIPLGKSAATVYHVPGHTDDQCVLYFPDAGLLFSGDTLFAGSVGGTSGETARNQQLDALRQKIVVLPDRVRVFPGHGPITTVGIERRANPFLA
ncbi:MAG: hydroxyacylglutathione hydrolase family protein [Candidatus Sumerlaea chitinivorans]|nr:hydroxyacylglutathione hydrolase family protein [Candidatus Sumerlaea chitinivorans]